MTAVHQTSEGTETVTAVTETATADCALTIRGNLTPEETAALTAVVQAAALQAQQADGTDASSDDRTLDRRRRLGLWDRPGPGSWKNAAGWN